MKDSSREHLKVYTKAEHDKSKKTPWQKNELLPELQETINSFTNCKIKVHWYKICSFFWSQGPFSVSYWISKKTIFALLPISMIILFLDDNNRNNDNIAYRWDQHTKPIPSTTLSFESKHHQTTSNSMTWKFFSSFMECIGDMLYHSSSHRHKKPRVYTKDTLNINI